MKYDRGALFITPFFSFFFFQLKKIVPQLALKSRWFPIFQYSLYDIPPPQVNRNYIQKNILLFLLLYLNSQLRFCDELVSQPCVFIRKLLLF